VEPRQHADIAGLHLRRARGQFIIEGAITVGLAFFALFWLPRRMSQAWFLEEPERAWVEERMARDSGGQDNSALGITKSDIVETCKDWKFCAWAWAWRDGPQGAGRSADRGLWAGPPPQG
jgi:hypothetical protein